MYIMNSSFNFLLSLSLLTAFIFSSCEKEQGCTDSTAMNYFIDAEEDDGSCIYAYDLAQGIWNINPDCEELTVPVIGTISLNDQIPETIEVQGAGNNTLFIDIDGTQVSGDISSTGYLTVNNQSVSIDPGLGFPLDVIVSGDGQISSANAGFMNLTYSFDIPLVGSEHHNQLDPLYFSII